MWEARDLVRKKKANMGSATEPPQATENRYTITALDVPRHYDRELMATYERRKIGSGRTAIVINNGDSVVKIFKYPFKFNRALLNHLAAHDMESALEYVMENMLDDELTFAFIEIRTYLAVEEAKLATDVVPPIPSLLAIAVVEDLDTGEQYLALELTKIVGEPLDDKLDRIHEQLQVNQLTELESTILFDDLKAVALSMQDLATALDFLSSNGLVDLDLNLTNIMISEQPDDAYYTITKVDLGSIRPQEMWGSDIEYTGAAQYLPWGTLSSEYLEALWFKDFKHKSAIANSLHQHAFARVYYEILSGDALYESTDQMKLRMKRAVFKGLGYNHPLLERFGYIQNVLNAANFEIGLKFRNCRLLEGLLYIGLNEKPRVFQYLRGLVDYALLKRLPYSDTKTWVASPFDALFAQLDGDDVALARICDILNITDEPSSAVVIDALMRNEFDARVDLDETELDV